MTKEAVVGVVRGGRGHLYDVSLLTGLHVLANLPDKYEPLDILITKDGVWHMHGVPVSPEYVARRTDVIFNALHGEYGEDGKIQHILESLGVPYTGSKGFPSILSINKHLARDIFKKHGFKTPRGTVIHKNDDINNALRYIFNTVTPPWIIKPSRSGISLGVSFARSFEELGRGVEEGLKYSDSVLVEEYIKGKEVTVPVVLGTDNSAHVLPAILIQKEGQIFNHYAKQSGLHRTNDTEDLLPEEHWMVKNAAGQLHKKLGLGHYSRTDFILHPKRGLFVLEINSLPQLHRESVFHQSLKLAGTSFKDFLGHVVELARGEK